LKVSRDSRNGNPSPGEGGSGRRRLANIRAAVFTALVLLATAGALYRVAKTSSPWGEGRALVANFREPSGIVFHPIRKTLFVVGDEGDVGEVTTEGFLLRAKSLGNRDLEGVTVDPFSGLLYALVERENRILEISPATLEVRRSFDIDGRWNGRMLIAPGSEGMEGIAFVAGEGGGGRPRVFVANRGPVLEGGEVRAGGSFLAELDLPLDAPRSKKAVASIVRAAACNVDDISDLAWHVRARKLFAISDHRNCLVRLDFSGVASDRIGLPGRRQEGLAFDDAGFIYIAQDSGGVLKMRAPRGIRSLLER